MSSGSEALDKINKSFNMMDMASMSEVSSTIEDIRTLETATAIVDYSTSTVRINFLLNGESGSILLKPRKDVLFNKKIYAAARAKHLGRFAFHGARSLNGRITTASIKILTNMADWELLALRYDSIRIGESNV